MRVRTQGGHRQQAGDGDKADTGQQKKPGDGDGANETWPQRTGDGDSTDGVTAPPQATEGADRGGDGGAVGGLRRGTEEISCGALSRPPPWWRQRLNRGEKVSQKTPGGVESNGIFGTDRLDPIDWAQAYSPGSGLPNQQGNLGEKKKT